ncbi:MAG: NAD(P)H-dependent oxidoreductase subunit E [Spirochaetes bacterium]|nr:NAD(P)H-dependent oxidoreductase subunit E [Spirochaetota bacterium]MBU1080703.1 NAD(P)H-dependent oxidoreductase subunit E [Spirochaetota bacterium]
MDTQTATSPSASARGVQDQPGALLTALEDAQRADEHNYLSEDTLRAVALEMDQPLSRVYSVATFYSFFNLKPQGKHTIVVCRGTACHTRGSLGLLREAAARLGMPEFREDEEPSFTTDDRLFTVRTVACFGQCALAPVVSVDGTIYSRMTQGKLCSILDSMRKGATK